MESYAKPRAPDPGRPGLPADPACLYCRAMTDRYRVRPDPRGFSVQDIWTGEPAVIALVPQTGLSQEDAEHTAALLNTRATRGDLSVMQ